MKDRPILFSAPMVRAILDGRKTQTRRIVQPSKSQTWATPDFFKKVQSFRLFDDLLALDHPGGGPGGCIRVPYHRADRLWVRETWGAADQFYHEHELDTPRVVAYRADLSAIQWDAEPPRKVPKYDVEQWNWDAMRWRPSIHMPRWASRITLEIVSVRVERLQDISEADAKAEGLNGITKDGTLVKYGIPDRDGLPGTDDFGWPWRDWNADPRNAYRTLWESINGPGSWETNPLVWVVEFKKLEGEVSRG